MSARRPSTPLIALAGALLVGAIVFVWTRSSDERPTTPADQGAPASSEPTGAAPRSAPVPAARDDGEPLDEANDDGPLDPRRPPPSGTASPSGDPSDPLATLRAAKALSGAEGVRALVAAMRSQDDVVVAEAAKELIARKATSAIRGIADIDLAAAGGGGLSVVDALGKLGAMAGGGDRSAAVERLLSMLAEEKQRMAPESPANLIQIYEALGELGDARAARALEAELLDPAVPRAPKVVVVKSLVKLGQAESRGPLEKARTIEAAARGADAFEEEIRVELVGEIEKALTEL